MGARADASSEARRCKSMWPLSNATANISCTRSQQITNLIGKVGWQARHTDNRDRHLECIALISSLLPVNTPGVKSIIPCTNLESASSKSISPPGSLSANPHSNIIVRLNSQRAVDAESLGLCVPAPFPTQWPRYRWPPGCDRMHSGKLSGTSGLWTQQVGADNQ